MIHIGRQIVFKKSTSQNQLLILNKKNIKKTIYPINIKYYIIKLYNNYNFLNLGSILINKIWFRRW